MKINNLIWSNLTIHSEKNQKLHDVDHVTASYDGELINLRMYTSSQGTSVSRSFCFSYPRLVKMTCQQLVIEAYTWGDKPKENKVILTLTF